VAGFEHLGIWRGPNAAQEVLVGRTKADTLTSAGVDAAAHEAADPRVEGACTSPDF
jgi:hypothetical protein